MKYSSHMDYDYGARLSFLKFHIQGQKLNRSGDKNAPDIYVYLIVFHYSIQFMGLVPMQTP